MLYDADLRRKEKMKCSKGRLIEKNEDPSNAILLNQSRDRMQEI